MNVFSAFQADTALLRRCGNSQWREASHTASSGETAGNRSSLVIKHSHEGGGVIGHWSAPAEKRRGPRHQQRLPLALSIFNRPGVQEAWLINCSQEGVCVETEPPLLPGTSIHLRVVASVSMDEPFGEETPVFPGLRTTALGEVKWCAALSPGRSAPYRIGIRYYPYY